MRVLRASIVRILGVRVAINDSDARNACRYAVQPAQAIGNLRHTQLRRAVQARRNRADQVTVGRIAVTHGNALSRIARTGQPAFRAVVAVTLFDNRRVPAAERLAFHSAKRSALYSHADADVSDRPPDARVSAVIVPLSS